MSSNSSEHESVEHLLGRSLDDILRFVPGQYLAICSAMGELAVGLRIDKEAFTLSVEGDRISLSPTDQPLAVRLGVTSKAIVSLIDGKADLLDAILNEAISIYGGVTELVQFDDALLAYLHGAVRSPRQSEILTKFRALSQQRSELAR